MAGTPLVWVVDPAKRTATVISVDESTVTLGVNHTLAGLSAGDLTTCGVTDTGAGYC
jgi:hypothetical protein